ncbi:hypothetical protein [Agromyces silvae]|uniref:hypothetical protein n=1 Tax=Agromyces silvae TaxID=3388266 RepID=UPI00280C1F5B|nr:hypothetical protein [Agromyces protaetiae]
MTASKSPEPEPERTTDGAATEILPGAGPTDPDRGQPEGDGPVADRTPGEVPGDDRDQPTKTSPTTSGRSTRVPPKPKATAPGDAARVGSAAEAVGRRDDDSTTEVLAGHDADGTPTEVLDGARDAQETAVLPETEEARTTQVLPAAAHTGADTRVLPETADTGTTRVLPETWGLGGSASSGASAPRPEAPADLTPPPAPAATSMPEAAPLPAEPALRARVRWAGIIWGLVFAAAAVTMIWVLAEPERRESVGLWWAGLTPAGLGLTALIVAGGLLLIGGLTGLARHLSTRSTA